MSMLAEPKRKLRWSLNPRGNLWVNDNKKFGQKMLEKMGWNKGKGLGKHENGMTENVKVSYKNDSKGIGWNESDGNWIAHQDEFNAILCSLNKNVQEKTLPKEKCNKNSESCISSEASLEMRSKSFKSRVHYKKFVLGKDVSQYKEQDMESIFGGKLEAHRTELSESDKDDGTSTKSENDSGVCDSFHGVQTYKSNASVSDYFESKMKERVLLLNQSAACKKVTSASNKCEEKIEVDKVPDVADFETEVMSKKKKKKDCQTRTKNGSASKESKSVLAINVCPPLSYETLPKELSKKRKYKILSESGETVCPKRLKTCPNQPVTTSAPNVLRSCLKNTSTNGLKKTVKSVTFSSGHLSYPESVVSTTGSNNTEYSQCSESTILPVTSDELSSGSVSETKPLDCLEHGKNPDKWSNDNSWSVSEKLALKMGHYRSILNRISEHSVFSTTNLLEIKGYGNW